MPDLKTLLASYDLAFLRDIAELWGIELQAAERRTILVELATEMTSKQLFDEVFASLPPTAAGALTELGGHGGAHAGDVGFGGLWAIVLGAKRGGGREGGDAAEDTQRVFHD